MKRLSLLFAFLLLLTIPSSDVQAQTKADSVSHPWRGAKVAYFGDSITDPRNKGAKKKYWNFLEQWLGCTPWVYAVSGREWNDIPRQTAALKAEHGDDVDAIMIFIGTNDYNHGVRIGEWWVETDTLVEAAVGKEKSLSKRRMRVPSFDKTTYRGRINIALSQLKEAYPTKQIILLTPIHRDYFYGNEKNIQPSERYQNSCGEYIDAYIDAVKEASQVWAVPMIDISSLSGLYPCLEGNRRYFHDSQKDLLHPNDEGHRRIALTLMYQLQSLPCRF